jgi:hypothetical protein
MDLPSIDLARETLVEEVSEASSFTEAPCSLMDLDEDFMSLPDSEISPSGGGFGRLGMPSPFTYDEGEGFFDDSEDDSAFSLIKRRQISFAPKLHSSDLENLPVEVSSFILRYLVVVTVLTDI